MSGIERHQWRGNLGTSRCGHRLATVEPDELLAACATGNAVAFGALYEHLEPRVLRLARAVTKDQMLAEEVSQNVFLEVWRSSTSFDPACGSAWQWISTITRRRAIDSVRSERRRRDRTERFTREAATQEVDCDTMVLAVLDGSSARSALLALTAVQRESIALAFFAHLSHTQIAAHLNVPLGTVKTRIRDGLAELRVLMAGSPLVMAGATTADAYGRPHG